MSKVYKHKILGWTAKYVGDDCYHINKLGVGIGYKIDKELIEGSNDWEELGDNLKSDWIDLARKTYHNLDWGAEFGQRDFREAINKYLPKITDDIIEKICEDYFSGKPISSAALKKAIKQNLPKDLLANPE